jgi:hypothetical protein
MAGRMDDAMHEKPLILIPGMEEPHHLKVAPFVSVLLEALGPLGKAEQDRVLQALVPLWKQVGASDVPSSAEGFHRKFGLAIEIKRKLKRIDYDTATSIRTVDLCSLLHFRTGHTRLPRCANTARR